MTLKKKLVATAVGGALTLGLGMPAAQANLLIPYVVKDTNRTTVVTVIGFGFPASFGASIHLQYWTKSTTDANTAACQPSSTALTFTDNDIVTFDTAGLIGAGPLFGDTTNSAPLGTSISYAGPRHGFLHIEPLDGDFLQGTWIEVDIANGGAHGDVALNNFENTNNADFNYQFGLSPWMSLSPGPVFDDNFRTVPFWPSTVASTVFTVTPLGSNMSTSDNNSVVLQVRNSNGDQGAYDRNENGIDGTVPQTVRCVGRLTAAQLMPGVVTNAAWAANGGWGWLMNLGDNDTNFNEACTPTGDCSAAVYQIDTSIAAGAGKFMSTATRISSWDN